jgi:hypothetical protein
MSSSSSALDPFDPSWLDRPVRAGLALVDVLQLTGERCSAVVGLVGGWMGWSGWLVGGLN